MSTNKNYGLTPNISDVARLFNRESIFNYFLGNNDNGFVDNGQNYTASITLPYKIDESHLRVEFDSKTNTVTTSYAYKDDNSNMEGNYCYSLPDNADPDTLTVEFDKEMRMVKITADKTDNSPTVKKIEIKKK